MLSSHSGDLRRPPPWLVAVTSAWALLYAGYRAYYAFGGTVGLIGRPVSDSRLQAINAAGAAIILVAALLPWPVLLSGRFRRITPVLGWLVAVGCCMHALVDSTLRVLSLTGVHPTRLPSSVWASYDRRAADLQDLFLNEPWFLVQGLLWAALTLSVVRRPRRRAWLVSAVVATAALTVVGVLSGLDVLGSFTVL
jgi:hypothetical protein